MFHLAPEGIVEILGNEPIQRAWVAEILKLSWDWIFYFVLGVGGEGGGSVEREGVRISKTIINDESGEIITSEFFSGKLWSVECSRFIHCGLEIVPGKANLRLSRVSISNVFLGKDIPEDCSFFPSLPLLSCNFFYSGAAAAAAAWRRLQQRKTQRPTRKMTSDLN